MTIFKKILLNILNAVGSGALSGKMLIGTSIENNKNDANFRSGSVELRLALPRRVRTGLGYPPAGAKTRDKNTLRLFFE